MTPLHHLKRSLATLLALGLVLLVSLFVVRSLAGLGTQPATTALSAGTPETTLWATNTPQGQDGAKPATSTMNPPTAAPAAAGKRPPACTFPLADIKPVESQPETYTFSEPKVVLTDERQPDIVEWLPDNQNVLIMPSQFIDLGMNGYRQTIELFNPETKEIQIYATRRNIDKAPPVWNSALNAIVYSDMNVPKGSTITNFKFTRQLRISYGNPDDTQLLADDLPQYGVTVKPDGSQIAYFTAKQLVKLDTSLKAIAPVAFDRKALDFKRNNPNAVDAVDYIMAWRPNSSQIFVYNWAGDNLGYTYIMDTDSEQICSLDFGGWAEIAHWSPNGRYLVQRQTSR